MKVFGRVIDTIPKERILKLLSSEKVIYLYFQRKDFREFGPYFFDKPYLCCEVKEEKRKICGLMTHEVTQFLRIVQPSKFNKCKKRTIYYDLDTIRQGVKDLVNKEHNKLFIDLEFTMPAYYQTMPHVQEIIQYGIVVEDTNGKIVFEDSSLVKPLKSYNLNGRTLKFLSRKKQEFDNAIPYMDFYELLKKLIKEYKPKIYAWGRSDMMAIEQSFAINKVKPLDVRNNHINLMQIIKNYYNYKEEMGLFQTYCEMANISPEVQAHDALEDAMIEREIFRMFKEKINIDE